MRSLPISASTLIGPDITFAYNDLDQLTSASAGSQTHAERRIQMTKSSNENLQYKQNVLIRLIYRLEKYFRINTIVYFPVLLSALVFGLSFLIGKEFYPIHPPDWYIGITFLVMVLLTSLSGIIQIIIEEVPGWLWPVQGKGAVLFGIIWVVLFWLFGIYIIWYYFL